MHWNYRVAKITEDGETVYGIVEAYYDDAIEGVGYAGPLIVSDTLEGLKETLGKVWKSLDEDVLEIDNVSNN